MSWAFPVSTGKRVQVRLYFANRCSCTSAAGQRRFDVRVDGVTKLGGYDIAADAGHLKGTMKAFDVTSDGSVNIDFIHGVENPLINAIEIVDLDAPAPSADNTATRRSFTGSSAGAASPVPASGSAWGSIRGAFHADGRLWTVWNDGTLTVRSYDGNTFGAVSQVNLNGLTPFSSDAQAMTGLFYDKGRIYYTLAADPKLYSRYFTAESGAVGSARMEVPVSPADIDGRNVNGTFLAGG